MKFATWFFLESTIALGAASAVLLFILLVYWRNTLRGKPMLFGLILVAVLLIVQAAVVTSTW